MDEAHVPAAEPDFAGEGLLDGLEGDAREERRALLTYLAGEGASPADLRRHTSEGTLMFLPAERVTGGHARYREAEVLSRADVDAQFLHALRQAMGLPIAEADDRAYIESDVEAARLGGLARQAGLSDEEIIDVTRVLGRGLAQAAELMRTTALRLVLEPGLSETDLARRFAGASETLAPLTDRLVGHLLTLHLRQVAQIEAINAAERTGGQLPGSREVTVCFADLVGFTRRGEEVPADELGHLAHRLEALTTQAICPPVTLVKTIGDAVMLVCPDPTPLLANMLDLVDRADADAEGGRFPQLRVGVALGPALRRAGDWYGRPVNLASRLTGVARPGSVLASRAVRDGARDDYRWSSAGERRLKGVPGAVSLFRARRLDSEG